MVCLEHGAVGDEGYLVLFYENGKPRPKANWLEKAFRYLRARVEQVTDFPRSCLFFVKNFWKFRKILWTDRDWDYGFLYDLLKFKLSDMAKHQRAHSYHEGAERYAKQLDFAVFLIDRITKDYYWEEDMKKHEDYWGENIWDFVERPEEHPAYGKLSELHFYTLRSRDENRQEEEREARMQIHYRAEERKQKDIKRLFKHICRYHQGWWC